MSYIDQSSYSDILKKFAEGSKKQKLQENYIDLRPINSLHEELPTKMSHIYAKYPEGMYESEMEEGEMPGTAGDELAQKMKEQGHDKEAVIDFLVHKKHMEQGVAEDIVDRVFGSVGETKQQLSPKQKKIASMAPPEDKITGADFAAMRKGKKDEGLYGDGPKLTGPSGYKLENLSLEERTQLKEYIQAVKTTEKAIQELLEKAKTPRMEANNTNLTCT